MLVKLPSAQTSSTNGGPWPSNRLSYIRQTYQVPHINFLPAFALQHDTSLSIFSFTAIFQRATRFFSYLQNRPSCRENLVEQRRGCHCHIYRTCRLLSDRQKWHLWVDNRKGGRQSVTTDWAINYCRKGSSPSDLNIHMKSYWKFVRELDVGLLAEITKSRRG